MHYFYAEANRSLPPIRTGIGAQGKKWNEKYFKPLLMYRLINFLDSLSPFTIDFLFVDNESLIDLNSPVRSFARARRLLLEEAERPQDCELIWFMFSKKIMNLQITQSVAIKKFAAHDTKNLFIRCCAKTLQPDWKFEPEKILKQLQQGYRFLTRWLKQISSHEIFKEWGILLKFQTWQEVEVPPKLIKRGINIPFEKRLPLPGDETKNPKHLPPLKLTWLLINCRHPRTRITVDGEWLYLPYFSKYMVKALENNPVPGLTIPLIRELMPKRKT